MVDLFVNMYRIWWCPNQVALHLRLQLGTKGGELVHMIADDSPTVLKWRDDRRKPLRTVKVGTTDLATVELARRYVDPHFCYYNVLYRNCTAYVYCLLSEILGEQTDVLEMVAQTNRPFVSYFGTDFIDINQNMGCWHALRRANDAWRACYCASRLASSPVVTALLDAQHGRCSCRLRRDQNLRQACASLLKESPDVFYRFIWSGVIRAMTTTERLYQLIAIRC